MMLARRCRPLCRVPSSHTLSWARGFRALVADKSPGDGTPASTVQRFGATSELPRQDPNADVEISVTHSTINYKDAMIINGQKGVVRKYPIVGGIDYAGIVAKSSSPLWKEGDKVVLTGNKAGQYFDGGYSERATCRAEWLVEVPPEFSVAQSMTIGTAGVTAAMCVHYLEAFGGEAIVRAHPRDGSCRRQGRLPSHFFQREALKSLQAQGVATLWELIEESRRERCHRSLRARAKAVG